MNKFFQNFADAELQFLRLNLPTSISFLARNSPKLSSLFTPTAPLYKRSFQSSIPLQNTTANLRIAPKLNQCFTIKFKVPNLNSIFHSLKTCRNSNTLERPAVRIAVCEVNSSFKITPTSNSFYMQIDQNFTDFMKIPIRVKNSKFNQITIKNEEIIIRTNTIQQQQFLLFEFTAVASNPQISSYKYEIALANAVISLSAHKFSEFEIPSSQASIKPILSRVDAKNALNLQQKIFKTDSELNEAERQSVCGWKTYDVKLCSYGIFNNGAEICDMAVKVNRCSQEDRNRLGRLPESVVLLRMTLPFLDHAAGLICAQKVSEERNCVKMSGNHWLKAFQFIKNSDAPRYYFRKIGVENSNSIGIYCISVKWGKQGKGNKMYQESSNRVIEPEKYKYKDKLILTVFAEFLVDNEEFLGVSGGVSWSRVGGGWKEESMKWRLK